MPRKKMYVEWDKGASPANSRTRAGKRSPLVFDADGNLVGHVVPEALPPSGREE